jgi:hypothetical protein
MSARPVRCAAVAESPSADRSSRSSGIGPRSWNISVPASGQSDICRFMEIDYDKSNQGARGVLLMSQVPQIKSRLAALFACDQRDRAVLGP